MTLVMIAGCGDAREGSGRLPPPAAKLPAQDSVANRFTEVAPGVFARSVYRTAPSPELQVEVRDVEVAPRTARVTLSFPGAALLEIRAGRAEGRVRGDDRAVQAGGILALSQGDTLVLVNVGAAPLSLRVYVLGAATGP